MPLSQCNEFYLEYNERASLQAFRNGLSESQYCTHDPNGKSDSCEGDSGGPIQLIYENAPIAKIVGIVSFGSICGSTLPSINTRVASYLDWIESIIWPNVLIFTP